MKDLGLKRHYTKPITKNPGKKHKLIEEIDARIPSPSSSGKSSKETSNDVASEGFIYKETSQYDNLLTALSSSNCAVANAYEKRKRQGEGKSDTEEDEDSDSGSIGVSEEEDISEEGTDMESPGSSFLEAHEGSADGILEEFEETEKEDDLGSCGTDTDMEDEVGVNEESIMKSASSTSPFYRHFGYKLSNGEVESISQKKWKYDWEMSTFDKSKCKWMGTGETLLKDNISSDYGMKESLYKHWLTLLGKPKGDDFHSSKKGFFFSLWNSYRDVLHCKKKPFYLKRPKEDSTIMDSYLMHSLNHIFRARDIVAKNDAKVTKLQEGAQQEILAGDGFLDRGFTRPKVLILLPMRSVAFRAIRRLIQLTPTTYKSSVEYNDRFLKEFGSGDVEDNEDDNMPTTENPEPRKSSKPSDFETLFGGNNDDDFMIGIKFTRKNIKLYNDFYSSDMIVASPLCLHRKIEISEIDKDKDVDYLSSIEVLIIDHADVISMQNWSFLTSVVEHLNCIPSKQHDTDVMRIRRWYLDGHAKFYRQTIMLSYYINPDMNAMFNHNCLNYEGKVKLVCKYKGVLQKVLLQVPQVYYRFDADSIACADDARLEYFVKQVFPKIKNSTEGGIMLFISSYFEFVRIRNFLKSQEASFCLLGDYTKQADISRGRLQFFEGRRKIMLYTERFHFYYRYKIRGIKNLIIYSLPERKGFYPELLNMVEASSHEATCSVLFSRFDLLRLERIAGSDNARKMIKSEKHIFTFC